jgi:hypothetical protein
MITVPAFFARLGRDRGGVAAIEWALSAPIVIAMFLNGAELTNYAIATMRLSQIALHVADNASRIGTSSLLTAPQISETQINDLFVGANLQGGGLDLRGHGRVVLSSLEPIATPTNPTGKFKVHWQRCYGTKVSQSTWGTQGTTNLTEFGPTGKKVTAIPDNSGVMYVEIFYDYQPLISSKFVPKTQMKSTAAMVIRDDRDFVGPTGSTTGIYNTENAAASSCS